MTAHPNIPELAGTYPVVLYFGSQADADDFIALVQQAKPGLVAKPLAPLESGRSVTRELFPEVHLTPEQIEGQEREQIQKQRECIERRRGNAKY